MSETAVEVTERELVIQGLREFADFLEAHPTIPASQQNFLSYVYTREELAKIARLTSWQKVYEGDNYFTLRKTFSSGARFDVYTERSQVCRKVVTGTRTVAATPEHEEEIVEWVCEDAALLGGR